MVHAGKEGQFAFEINYPKLPQSHYVLYIGKVVDDGNGYKYLDHGEWALLDESKGAVYLEREEWESYHISDVNMRTGRYGMGVFLFIVVLFNSN